MVIVLLSSAMSWAGVMVKVMSVSVCTVGSPAEELESEMDPADGVKEKAVEEMITSSALVVKSTCKPSMVSTASG
jgi:hypothetical protein